MARDCWRAVARGVEGLWTSGCGLDMGHASVVFALSFISFTLWRTEPLRELDELPPLALGARMRAIARGSAASTGKEPASFVETDGVDGHTGADGKFTNCHFSVLTLESRPDLRLRAGSNQVVTPVRGSHGVVGARLLGSTSRSAGEPARSPNKSVPAGAAA